MELSRKVEDISRAVSAQFVIVSVLLFALSLAVIALDAQFAFFGQFPRSTVRSVAKALAKIGIIASFLALAYYLLREMYLQTRKRKLTLPAGIDSTAKVYISSLRYLHPLLGVGALSLLVAHAYIMFSGWLGPIAHPKVYSGVTALLFIGALAVIGLQLRRLPARRGLRILHRCIAAGFILGYVVHKIL